MDYESRFAENAHIEDDLKQLKAPLGVYIIYGNHEYRANRNAKYRWLQKTGGTLLIDSVVQPDSTFYLIGRDDFIHKKRKSLHSLMEGVDTGQTDYRFGSSTLVVRRDEYEWGGFGTARTYA